jgi:hypothetical protein
MAAAVAPIFGISDYHSPGVSTAAGWIGSKAGVRGAFVKVDANGFIDQAAAVTNAVATVRVGVLDTDVASTVAAASADALAVQYRPCTNETEIELPLITSGTSLVTFVAPVAANVGDLLGLARRTAGDYCWDTTGTDYGRCIRVNVARGTVTCVLISTIAAP